MVYKIKHSKSRKTMKKKPVYYYKIVESKVNRTYGGREEKAEVYKIKGGQIVKVGEIEWTTRGYKGAEGEVMDVLLKAKEIDEKEYKKSENKWRGAGYYSPSENSFEIREL